MNGLFSFIVLQIIYDEGPLYIFAKNEDIQKQWIHKLKHGKYDGSQTKAMTLKYDR